MPAAWLIVNLGAPFRIRAGTDIEAAEYADGVVVTTPTRALEFGYPPGTRSVGVHFKPWGLAPFLPMPAAELCDRPVTVEEVWGRPTVAELRDRLATAAGPHEMLTLLEDQLMRLVCETAGLGLVRHTSSVIAAATGAVAIGDLSVAAGVSSTHLAQRFKEVVGVTPKRLARTYRFTATVLAIDPAGPVDWLELADCAGYYDQAHFGHEFRTFTGLTPTRYLDVRRRFLREHPGHPLDSDRCQPIDFLQDLPLPRRHYGHFPSRGESPWARWSCTARCRWTASSRTNTTSPARCSTGCPAVTSRSTRPGS
jgi:AraC-like DNA-binding protein